MQYQSSNLHEYGAVSTPTLSGKGNSHLLIYGDDEKLWKEAKQNLFSKMMLKDLRGKDEKQLQGFLEKSESVLEMRQLCDSVHETADEKYTTSERKIKDEVVLPSIGSNRL